MKTPIERRSFASFVTVVVLAAIAAGSGCVGDSSETSKPSRATSTATAPELPAQPGAPVAANVNSKGLRATREIEYTKPNGRMRVVCVGGATTFGEGVDVGAAYPAWIQRNMRGRGYDVEVLNAGKPGLGAAESAALLESELLKYGPDLVVVSVQRNEGTTTPEALRRIEAILKERKIVYVLLAVPDFVDHPARLVETFSKDGYEPKQPDVYLVPAKAALDAYVGREPLFDVTGRWAAGAHARMGNALAEMIVGIPLICCAKGPVSPEL